MARLIKLSNLLMLTLFLTTALNAQQDIVIDKVIARVGTEHVLISDVESQFSFQSKRIPNAWS